MAEPVMKYALVDWGTSSFRLWITDVQGHVLGESRSDEGMMHCALSGGSAGFAPVLEKHLQKLDAPANLPVMICGMAGARQGWAEAPYINLPTALDGLATQALRIEHQTRDIRILPGLAQREQHSANVMRGEETQLAGVAASMPNGLICMPGTHSKWTKVEGGIVTQFTTFMTGELFAVLSQHSILRHAVDAELSFDSSALAFVRAVETALAEPARMAERLFGVRATQLLGFEEDSDGAAHLSGLLIGSEIGRVKQLYGTGTIGLVATGALGRLYQAVLQKAGFEVILHNGETVVRQGLFAAASRLWPVADMSGSKE